MILSTLSRGLIERSLFKVEIVNHAISDNERENALQNISNQMNISVREAEYFYFFDSIGKDMYSKEDDSIEIMYKDGITKDIAEASDMLNISLLSKKVKKYYVCSIRL